MYCVVGDQGWVGVRCTVCRVPCAVCRVRCAVCGVRCAVCGVGCGVCGVRCGVCGVRCGVLTELRDDGEANRVHVRARKAGEGCGLGQDGSGVEHQSLEIDLDAGWWFVVMVVGGGED